MQLSDISVPECYKESADFRFFLDWFAQCLEKIKFDTDNLPDLVDPQRCPKDLLWLLCDTMGFKYDDRITTANNRLILLYFMSMIYNRGCKNGVTLAAEVNLAQFNMNKYAQENEVLENRLEDTSIPVNSAYVTGHPDLGYIDIVYYSENIPIDTCIEYVRPLGMYCFQSAGVRVDSRTKLSVDARLTYSENVGMSIGPTHVGHYRRNDYASLQSTSDDYGNIRNEKRKPVYYRNSESEGHPTRTIDPGLRSIYSLQLCNNEHIVKSLIPSIEHPEGVERDPIFSLGYGPQSVDVVYPDNYLNEGDNPMYNLRYDKALEESISGDVYTLDPDRIATVIDSKPQVNPIMHAIGDAISLNSDNTTYIINDDDEGPHIEDV